MPPHLRTARRRPDAFTVVSLTDYLRHRHQRWPETGNPFSFTARPSLRYAQALARGLLSPR